MTATTTITEEKRLTVLKHLAGGKDLDMVAVITKLDRSTVLDIGSHHGYPSTEKLAKAVDLVAAKIDRERNDIPQGKPLAGVPVDPPATPQPHRPASSSPSSVTSPDARPMSGPDEIRVLINTAKSHPAKRIQQQADRVLDALGKLRDLIAADEAKHAEQRAAAAQKAAARAEIDRLEKQLAAAKAKLRSTVPAATDEAPTGVSASDLRTWAKEHDVDCPAFGRIPAAVREAYSAAHPDEAA